MPRNKNRLSNFWQELKRRRVLRSLAVYAGSAFIILEASTIIFPRWGLPDWTIDLVLYILILGGLINIVVSWFFDITPEGIEKTKPRSEIQESEIAVVSYGWKIATYVSLVAIVGLVALNIILNNRELQSGDIRTIMILPFKNYTGNEQLDMDISGLHYALIVDIGRLGEINVISKTTSDVYKDVDKTISQIASEQHADVILEPAVMRLDDSIFFELTAIAPDEKPIWHANYQEAKSQIFNLHNRITIQIADEVRIRLTNVEERLLAESRTADPDVLEAYIKGQLYLDQLRVTSLQLATQYFETAIRYDPEWGPAYAGMAMVGAYQQQMGFETPSTTIPKINQYLNKAFELDPNSARSHYAAAVIAAWTEWDWDKALQEFQKALELNPNNALCRMFYAHMLLILHRYDEALAQGARAVELDPLRPFILALNSVVLRMTGNDEEAYIQVEKALSIEPDQHFANRQLNPVSYRAEDYEGSLKAYLRIASYLQEDVKASVEQTFQKQGYDAAIEEITVEMEEMALEGDVRAVPLANLYLRINNIPRAIYWLEKGYELHDPNMPYLSVYRNEALRADPGYHELLRKMNLPLPEEIMNN